MSPVLVPSIAGPRRIARRAGALGLLALSCVLLSGCLTITEQAAVQPAKVGDLKITTELCARTAADTECSAGLIGNDSRRAQYFMGYLVPSWVVAPATVAWSGAYGDLTLTADAEYAAALSGNRVPPSGLHWIGFRSPELAAIPRRTEFLVTAKANLGIPAGSPAALPLATVVGARWIGNPAVPGEAVDRPVVCGALTAAGPFLPETQCVLNGLPTQSETTGDPAVSADIALSDASLATSSTPVSVEAGDDATVHFTPTSTRAPGVSDPLVALDATTTVPDATVIAPSALTLGADAPLDVMVEVPADTPAGTYDVRLEAAAGQRSATASLRVTRTPPPAPPAPPVPPATGGEAPVVATTPTADGGAATAGAAGPITAAPTPPAASRRSGSAVTLSQTAVALQRVLATTESRRKLRSGNPFDIEVDLPSGGFVRVSIVVAPKGNKKRRPPVLTVGTQPTNEAGIRMVRVHPTRQGRKLLRAGGKLGGYVVVRFWSRTGKTITTPIELQLGQQKRLKAAD